MVIIKEFDVFKATNEEWSKLNEIRKLILAEQEPNELPQSDEYFKVNLQENYRRKDIKWFNYTITLDDNLIGYINYNYWTKDSPSYEGNEKNVFFGLNILKKYFKKDIAFQVLEIMVKNCSEIGKTIFITESESEVSNAFNLSIGAKKVMVITESKLNINNISEKMLQKWISQGKESSPETIIKIFENHIPDAYIEEFAKSFTEAGNDEPQGDQDRGKEIFTVEYFRNQEASAKKTGLKLLTCCAIEPNGQISSFTKAKIFPGKEKEIDQDLTGVPRKFRGRNLGKWVKSAMILYLKEHYPESKDIITGNADSNEAMLHINNTLGFKKFKEITVYQCTLQDLENILYNNNISSSVP